MNSDREKIEDLFRARWTTSDQAIESIAQALREERKLVLESDELKALIEAGGNSSMKKWNLALAAFDEFRRRETK